MLTCSAADVATYVHLKRPDAERGAFLLRFVASGNAVVCAFGNDNVPGKPAAREVLLLRQYLRQAELREVGAGLSRDGHSWAVLVEVDVPPLNTEVGRAFHLEMVRACLEDLVNRAWREANQPAA